MESMRELTDIEFNEVAGGHIVFAIGSFTSTTNSAVVGIQANAHFNGGVDNTNIVVARSACWRDFEDSQ